MTEEDIARILMNNLEAVDEIDDSYETLEDLEGVGRCTILGYIFRPRTVRRWLPDYEGPGYYLSTDGTVRDVEKSDFEPTSLS